MAENISDVTVNISIEDVVNLAAFGGNCLYVATESEIAIPYTEIYKDDNAEEKITAKEEFTADKAKALINAVNLAFMQDPCPEKIAVLSCPINNLTKYLSCSFRYLIPIGEAIENIEKLAEKIETSDKMLGVYLSTEEHTGAEAKLKAMKEKGYARTFVYIGVKNEDAESHFDCNQITTALLAKCSCKPVGSYTYKNQVLKGVYPDEAITKEELDKLHESNVNAFVKKAGYNVTSEGVCINGEYIDIMDARDWVVTQIQYQLQQALIVNDKVPYTNAGIGLLESTCVNVLQDAFVNGIIAEDDNGDGAYTVNFKARSETKASDREKRKYVEGRFSFELAGAIHKLVINGTIRI